MRAYLGIGAGAAGLVHAGAVMMLAAGSFAGPVVSTRFGRKPAVGGAVGLIALGSAVRGLPTAAARVGGDILVGLGIGMADVPITRVVKNPLGHGRCGHRRVRATARAEVPGSRAAQFACSAAFRAMPWPSRARASTVPDTELRRSSSPFCPDSVRAATTSPDGCTVTFVPAVT